MRLTCPADLADHPQWMRRQPEFSLRLHAIALCLFLAVGGAAAQQPARPLPPPTLPPVIPLPGPGMLVVSCDPGGCWDEFGGRYDRAGGGAFVRGDGKSCLMIKNRMHCE